MSIPETLSVGLARRRSAHLFAQVCAAGLQGLGANGLRWWVSPVGLVRLSARLDGGAERVFEFSGAVATQPVVLPALLARFSALEGRG